MGKKCCESAALNMPSHLENSAVATGLEKVGFHSNPKERQCQRMLKLLHNCTHLTRGNPLQCSCLESSRVGGAWWAAVSGVAQSRTQQQQNSTWLPSFPCPDSPVLTGLPRKHLLHKSLTQDLHTKVCFWRPQSRTSNFSLIYSIFFSLTYSLKIFFNNLFVN